MWKVVIEDDEGKRTVVPLSRDQYTIGRKDRNSIRLTERNVSREHARLYKKNGVPPADARRSPAEKPTYVLEDLTSYNGVFVNGLRITHAQVLAHGDLVQIGDYRIVLQDDAVPEASISDQDAKQTVPGTVAAKAAELLDRPNRLVMLAGPTPGAEYPLDRERLTVGRAEDATISINHNSVSRFHCEVHSLGEGRFEIVDKGSSNGVRVNGADLRRGIIEPGDVIELGDAKFKFVGAGQVFRPTESQRLAALSDRAAEQIVGLRPRRNALPIAIFTAVVAAGAVGAWVYTRPHASSSAAHASAASSPEQAALDEAKALCLTDCDAAHAKLEASLPHGSPLRASQLFVDIETRWADQTLARADADADSSRKRGLYQKVAEDTSVDPGRRKLAADKLQELDMTGATMAANLAPPPPSPPTPAPSREETPAPSPPSRSEGTHKTAAAPPPPSPPPPPPSPQ